MDNPYKVLGLEPGASDEEVKRAYRRLAKQYHPDRNPGDAAAAKKMQEINAAYDEIKNPKGPQGYDPFGGHESPRANADAYHQAARQYIRFGRYREALNALQNAAQRDAQWYYLSALAHDGLDDWVTALEHMRRAVSMEPDNYRYLQALEQLENGGGFYRQQAGNYRTFQHGGSCAPMCLCWLLQFFCCRC